VNNPSRSHAAPSQEHRFYAASFLKGRMFGPGVRHALFEGRRELGDVERFPRADVGRLSDLREARASLQLAATITVPVHGLQAAFCSRIPHELGKESG
jgi:hypothetical protein